MSRARRATLIALLVAGGVSCGGTEWVRHAERELRPSGDEGWTREPTSVETRTEIGPQELAQIPIGPVAGPVEEAGAPPERVVVGRTKPPPLVPQPADPNLFRNTYYDFPKEQAGPSDRTLFDASCRPLARVTQSFHDQVCVQGSGQLASGRTVSFAKRGCVCAAVCPRTAQQICFERLDPAKFPYGRGAMGRAITPLRTVAVDSKVIALGTRIFIPEMSGLPGLDGAPHDGCFVAEDRGVRVIGRQVDIFTGDPATTLKYNALFPSNRGVHVVIDDPRCAAR